MPRKILTAATAIAVAGFMPLAPASAQDMSASKPDTRPSITVFAPRARQTGRTYTGIPVETLTAQSVVYTDDLNLATEAGREQLHDRVQSAAESACEWLDEVYPMSAPMTTDNQCVDEAVARADDQVKAAIAAAG
ncbi:UrcA family protein [Novosphingobium malaysiense]|uniref:UrcA family protein n=1 Tax=Novosphingobium malaysiense TaxID=1348853 RepID=A0A0B1ZVF6_9SPHN|nr:UrcA family protein [Novosphingobium malaysiense]KHK93143.1 hypothetical protein LK12_02025 [Novosphingobium malaysiense]